MFKLAGHLGKTVGELKRLLTHDELMEWMAYDRLDPIGAYRSDLQTALLAMMQSGTKDAKLSDFILIDPNPVSEEDRQALEIEQQKEQRKQEMERLMTMIKKLDEK